MSERARGEIIRWFVAIVFTLPAVAFYVGGHYIPAKRLGNTPTGFIDGDTPLYMAYARQFFDDGFGLTYSQPYDYDIDAPRIYSQPHLFLLGVATRVTGTNPGIMFAIFGVIAAAAMMRVSIVLFEEVFSLERWEHWFALVAFAWGGGLIFVLSAAPSFFDILRNPYQILNTSVFAGLDPFSGWWCLNLGRTLIYPLESYYHVLVFGFVIMTFRKRYFFALAIATLLSWSHPYTGFELLAIALPWVLLERYLDSETLPRYFGYSLFAIFFFHVIYYLVFLNLFPQQRVLYEALQLDWSMDAKSFIPAYVIVAAMFAWRARDPESLKAIFSDPRNRLFIVWFLATFFLANHEFAIKPPAQPLHYTRGYVWTALFLLGGTSLIALFRWFGNRFGMKYGKILAVIVLLVFCADNITWLGIQTSRPLVFDYTGKIRGVHLTPGESGIVEWLTNHATSTDLTISEVDLGVVIPVYTAARPWIGHEWSTPYLEKKTKVQQEFYETGVMPDEWRGRNLFVVAKAGAEADSVAARLASSESEPVYQNSGYSIFRIKVPKEQL